MSRTPVAAFLVLSVLAWACAPEDAVLDAPTSPPSGSASEPSAPTGVDLSGVPTACISIDADDCERVLAEVAALAPSGIAARYVEVGPFGCPEVEGCARSLAARPQGDINIETDDGPVSYHVVFDPGTGALAIERQDAFRMPLPPESQAPISPGVRPFTLGHCGLWSGIDVGGSWWDPVGPIDGDHPAAINSADGTLAILDRDRATFTSQTGFSVRLIRRDGPKSLPGCM